MFSGATAFQAKFKCTNADTGPASSCAIPNYDQYYILAQNTCESEGYVTILNLNQCRIAGRALSGDASKGFAADQPANGYGDTDSGRTGGCTFHSGNVNNDHSVLSIMLPGRVGYSNFSLHLRSVRTNPRCELAYICGCVFGRSSGYWGVHCLGIW